MSKSIMQPMEPKECYLCGSRSRIQRHHCIGGIANRKLAERWGLWLYLCASCHVGDGGAQYEKELNQRLKREAQQAFEKTHTREEFMKIFGKNYL